MAEDDSARQFVDWFRSSSPYINAFRGRIFVIAFGGEAVADATFPGLIHDIALLNSLGIRLVLVHGARPQIERRLRERGARIEYVSGLRVTDDDALACVKEAVGTVRVEIEALLSMGLANSPMAGAKIRVASGNFVTARPIGVRDGIDHLHTGVVRRLDVNAVEQRLDAGAIVLLSPIGYSPTGEVFNLTAEDVATAAASRLQADKLIFLVEGAGILDADGELVHQLTVTDAEELVAEATQLSEEASRHLCSSVHACRHGVRRAHVIARSTDDGLLRELFTVDGVGTLVTDDIYEDTRTATIDDVAGILELIEPLEVRGVLVRRSREHLEMEIDHFTVMERDGMLIGCAALYPYPDTRFGELACLAIHPGYRGQGRGDVMLTYIEREAAKMGLKRLFVLTTQAAHWFRERGFSPAEIGDLPVARKALYNYQRNSKAFVKAL